MIYRVEGYVKLPAYVEVEASNEYDAWDIADDCFYNDCWSLLDTRTTEGYELKDIERVCK